MCREKGQEEKKEKKESRMMADRLLELGLGLASYSEEKISSFLGEISARGEARHEDIDKFRESMKEKGDAFRREFSARIEKEVTRAMRKLNLASAAEIEDLKKRLAEMEKNLKAEE